MLQYIDLHRLRCESNEYDKLYIINHVVLQKLRSYAQICFFSKEAGGVLVGRKDCATQAMIIEKITEPGGKDKRSRYAFYRSDHHQAKLIQFWKNSNHVLEMAGLWHTHPEDVPKPSPKDFQDLAKVIKTSSLNLDTLLYIIIGRKMIGCWLGNKSNLLVEHLGYISLEDSHASN